MGFLKDLVVQAVNFFYNISGSYGIAIIMLTILVRIIILPLNISSMKFSNISKKLNPKMEEIKKKYKDDKDKLNEATVELWQQYGVNPAAGCLPLLIQFPVLIAVIGALQLPELYQVAEPTFLGLNLMFPNNGAYAWEMGLPYLILPILSVITTYTSSKIMSAGNAQANMGTMNIAMTGLMGWITLRFPSGIALYWVVGNVFSICQYLIFNKLYENKELLPVEGVKKSEKSVIKSAKTVEEAIKLALIELNTARDNIEVDIIEPPSSGFLGLIGVKPAIIKVTELVSGLNSDSSLLERAETAETAEAVKPVKEVKKAPKQQKAKTASQQNTKQPASPKQSATERKPATEAQEQEIVSFVQQLANHIVEGSTAELVSTEEGIMHIAISGDNIGLIVGKHGETLNAIQYLTSLVYSKQRDGYHRVSIDAGGYRDKRKEKIIEFSKRMAEKARRTGRRISLEPMNSYERRIIHMALQEVEGINTFSEGDDPNRRVVIVAAGGDRSNRRYQRRPSNRSSKQNSQTEEQNQAAHEERNYQSTEKQRVQLESRTKVAPETKVSEPPKKPAKIQKPKQDKKVAETKPESNPYEHYYSKYDNRVKKK